ncbi:MAG TPA: alkaline phosphatase D family protein [Burkholderiales bacterium]|nr:alkaline phosphatase D family protein [Burkholderiales bacterium]
MNGRRRFLLGSLALGVPVPSLLAAADPFALGVASGYPTPGGMTLWTRLLGLQAPVPVTWELAADDSMRKVVRSGEALASPQWAHSIHVDVEGLEPDRWYWYRFRAGGAESAIGRTRTAPAAGAAARRMRFAFASCQQYEHGYYGAYRHIVADAPDLVAFLGDYVYEATWGRELVRSHGSPEAFTLEDYRARYALYKGDADLQAAHAACPWIATWDDHEVVNDYADDLGTTQFPSGNFLARRAAAYQAYYEHMPLPAAMRPRGPRLRLHATLDWGTLARFHVLDDRQYRSGHACPVPRRRGGASTTLDVAQCPELDEPARTMLGSEQEGWLAASLRSSSAAWNVLAQQTRMARWDQKPGPGRSAWTDGWDGYPAARRRLLDLLSHDAIRNPVVIGGDVHAFNVAQLKRDFDDPASPVVATEFVGTSISSYGPSQERLERLLPDNPHILFTEGRRRGYVRVDVTPRRWSADLRALETTKVREAPCSTLASFVVEDGRPGPQRAH